jgi:hypothetical protein
MTGVSGDKREQMLERGWKEVEPGVHMRTQAAIDAANLIDALEEGIFRLREHVEVGIELAYTAKHDPATLESERLIHQGKADALRVVLSLMNDFGLKGKAP